MESCSSLLDEVRRCTICTEHLAFSPRPVLHLAPCARIMVAGHAPGRKVHESGVPFADASGDRFREWMGLTREVFYDPRCMVILPMGFCFPGAEKTGDLPPRPDCASTWRAKLLQHLTNVKLTLVIGKYAQAYHLAGPGASVTGTVQSCRHYWPSIVPLPHPGPRNNGWLRTNP